MNSNIILNILTNSTTKCCATTTQPNQPNRMPSSNTNKQSIFSMQNTQSFVSIVLSTVLILYFGQNSFAITFENQTQQNELDPNAAINAQNII